MVAVHLVNYNQPSELEQTVYFEPPGLYRTSPDSGELYYQSRGSKRPFDPTRRAGMQAKTGGGRAKESEGGWGGGADRST